jgi:CubicO group peptidase (beta-lactamase class C family)
MGYLMVGAMLERLGKKTWEEMVIERIFTPFALKTAGFGPPSTMGRVDAPLGHAVLKDGTLKPMLAGPNGDNPLILGPAGTVHLSILDFAAWRAGTPAKAAMARLWCGPKLCANCIPR